VTGRARVPVLVGVGQVLQRTDDLEKAKEPLELMVDAVHAAAADAGSRELLARAGAVRVIRGMWRYGDPKDLGALAAFLASPKAQHIHGSNVFVDGGQTKEV